VCQAKHIEAEDRHKKEIERRMRPRTHEDFEILYDELENWRLHETARIDDAGMYNSLSYLILSYLILSYLILSYLILSYLYCIIFIITIVNIYNMLLRH